VAAGTSDALTDGMSTLAAPSADEAQRRVAQCRADFQRQLAQWASDCLALRRSGALRARWSAEDGCGGDITAALAA